ncbi:MAG: hypothetical protein AAB433_20860 [Nitrospirota bacterium]
MRMLKQGAVVALALDLLLLNGCGSGGDSSNGSTSSNTGTLQCTLLASGSVFSPGFNAGFIYQIAVDASNVYWYDVDTSTNTGIIKSVSKNGGAVTSLASGLGGVNHFAIDNTSIFWTEHNLATGAGAIKSVPKAGGVVVVLASGTPAGSAFDVFAPNGIALDNTFVYWGEQVGGGAVRRVPKAGGTVIDINRGQAGIDMLALDSPTAPTTMFYNSGGSFFSIPIAGGIPTVLASNVGSNIGIDFIVDDTSLFGFELANPGRVFSVPLAGGNPTYLATNLQNPHSLATDGTSLYYSGDQNNSATGGPGAIVKMAKTGGAIAKGLCIAAGTAYNANTLATDATNVYLIGYQNGGAGAGPIGILKAPKP